MTLSGGSLVVHGWGDFCVMLACDEQIVWCGWLADIHFFDPGLNFVSCFWLEGNAPVTTQTLRCCFWLHPLRHCCC